MNNQNKLTTKENDLLENKELREKYLGKIEALEKVKQLVMLQNTMYVTSKMVANYFEVEYDAIQKCIQRNKEELTESGLVTLRGKKQMEGYGLDVQTLGNTTVLTIMPKKVILNIAMLLRDSNIAKEIRNQLLVFIENNKENFIEQINEEQLYKIYLIIFKKVNIYLSYSYTDKLRKRQFLLGLSF